MKTYPRTLGVVVILSFVFFGLPALGDEQGMGNANTMYTSVVDKKIAEYEAKIQLKDSESANLQAAILLLSQEAVDASIMPAFLKEYEKELVAEMKRKDIGTRDYQIDSVLNEEFVEVSSSAWLQFCCAPRDPE